MLTQNQIFSKKLRQEHKSNSSYDIINCYKMQSDLINACAASGETLKIINQLDQLCTLQNLKESTTLFRALPSNLKYLIYPLIKGETDLIKFEAFTSTTQSINIATSLLDGIYCDAKEKGIMLKIYAPKGTYVIDTTLYDNLQFQKEEEYILPRNTTFRKINKVSSSLIELEIVNQDMNICYLTPSKNLSKSLKKFRQLAK
jgi:ADP-ribosyltransferase exoenzyme